MLIEILKKIKIHRKWCSLYQLKMEPILIFKKNNAQKNNTYAFLSLFIIDQASNWRQVA